MDQHPAGGVGLADRFGAGRHRLRGRGQDEPGLLRVGVPPRYGQAVGPVDARYEQLLGVRRERPEVGVGCCRHP
ncbi:hypothetical protein [Streptomyces globisporus]|uniref:hypothetical protein n=1 Tax=Streptomyces globisporus TaxID=1908 RepID=UPI003CC7F189